MNNQFRNIENQENIACKANAPMGDENGACFYQGHSQGVGGLQNPMIIEKKFNLISVNNGQSKGNISMTSHSNQASQRYTHKDKNASTVSSTNVLKTYDQPQGGIQVQGGNHGGVQRTNSMGNSTNMPMGQNSTLRRMKASAGSS